MEQLSRCSVVTLRSLHLQVSEAGMSVTSQWQAHDLETWSAAFDRWQVCDQVSPMCTIATLPA